MNSTISTNDRFDKLTNLDISTHYSDMEYYLFVSDFKSALAYWITSQNPNSETIEVKPALDAFECHVMKYIDNKLIPEKFSFKQLKEIISDDVFEKIPEVMALNNLKPDFIDLGALARNVFYMVAREQITQS